MASTSRRLTHAERRRRVEIIVRARARRRRTQRKAASLLLAVMAVVTFSAAAEGLDRYNYYSSDLPDPGTLNPQNLAQATQILDRNGQLLYLRHGAEIRTVVPLSKMAPVLRKATIDLEDRNFYQHHGLDLQRLASAGYADLTHTGVQQGASTITQQLVKRKYLSGAQTLDRKIKEALLAGDIENRYPKDAILEAYLNEIFYGHQAYGIEAASQFYFGKHAADLNLNEATLLAGIPQAPSAFDPLTVSGLKLTRERQKTVLEAMANNGDVTGAQVLQTAAEPVALHVTKPDTAFNAPHFVNYVLDYLRKQYGSELVDGGGLKVTTSLDLGLQQKAEAIVRNDVSRFGGSGVNNGAMLAMNPNSGEILTYVGSADFNNDGIDGQFDNIDGGGSSTYIGRQPGSSFKPYVYLTALSNGYTTGTPIEDRQGNYGGTTFHDFDNRSEGIISIRRALVESRNIPPILLMQNLGFQRVLQTAKALGITTNLKPELGTAIGSSEVRMLEHTSAYGVFATQGIYRPPAPVLKVEDASGKTIFKLKDTGRRVISPQPTYVLNDILLGYARQWGLNLVGPAAGKSGTTDDSADLWYMGYTPDLVVGSWMAHTGHKADGTSIGRYPLPGLYGVTTSAYIFKDFLPVYYSGRAIPQFQR
ncbi:MAG: transglycosylase domain-containing protein, partial [Candidatus Dormibacteraeota bacterium]|nr:transglycosylase domain-containing protein [Candidatus Dormibacteraeota bacterium]